MWLLIIAAVIAVYVISTYNGLVTLRERVKCLGPG